MVSDITGIDYELLKDNVILETTELPISIKNEKVKRCDFVIRILDDKIINLELNAYRYKELIAKNFSYLFQLFTSSTKKVEEYVDDLIVMQINLNCYKDYFSKPLSKYSLREDNPNRLYIKNIAIYDLNVVNCSDVYYNLNNKDDIPNYIRWGTLIYCKNFNDISNIVEGIMSSEDRDKIMSKLNKLNHEDLIYAEEEALEWVEWERKSIRTEARNEGRNEGIKESLKFTIKNMLKKNISLEDISDITGKTIEEINEIIK